MKDQTRGFRADVSSSALMVCDDGTEIPCIVSNISLQGAKIQFDRYTALPEEFRLCSEDLALRSESWVVWRLGTTAGVRFLHPIEIGSL